MNIQKILFIVSKLIILNAKIYEIRMFQGLFDGYSLRLVHS